MMPTLQKVWKAFIALLISIGENRVREYSNRGNRYY
jgi:hypothetical protein